jgi:hypothetical protein
MTYTPVILESPYSGNVQRNIRYARLCIRDCIFNHNEAPFASHLIYTQALDDTQEAERWAGIQSGFAWSETVWEGHPLRRVFYVDFGYSRGMELGKKDAEKKGQEVVIRTLPPSLFELLETERFEPQEWRISD